MKLSLAVPGKMSEALALFSEMQKKGIKPGMVRSIQWRSFMGYFLNLTVGENKANIYMLAA